MTRKEWVEAGGREKRVCGEGGREGGSDGNADTLIARKENRSEG